MSSFQTYVSRLPGVLVLIVACPATAQADNWPAWPGPTGQGHCAETNLPLKWSTTENVKRKVAMPAPGNSTPAIWGEQIFITQSYKEWLLLSMPDAFKGFDPRTGKELWRCEGLTQLVYNSPLYAPDPSGKGGIAVAMSGYGGAALAVIR